MRLNADQRHDVEALLIPIIQDAHRQADAVGAFLDALGVLPPVKNGKRQRVFLSADLLHKVAALVRIHQWEQAGLRPCFASRVAAVPRYLGGRSWHAATTEAALLGAPAGPDCPAYAPDAAGLAPAASRAFRRRGRLSCPSG